MANRFKPIAVQSEFFVTREEVRSVVKVFADMLTFQDKDPLRKFTFPTSINTVCTVEFDGPMTIDDFDALLAHIAFYKTFIKKNGGAMGDKYLSKQGMVDAVMDALDKVRSVDPA